MMQFVCTNILLLFPHEIWNILHNFYRYLSQETDISVTGHEKINLWQEYYIRSAALV